MPRREDQCAERVWRIVEAFGDFESLQSALEEQGQKLRLYTLRSWPSRGISERNFDALLAAAQEQGISLTRDELQSVGTHNFPRPGVGSSRRRGKAARSSPSCGPRRYFARFWRRLVEALSWVR